MRRAHLWGNAEKPMRSAAKVAWQCLAHTCEGAMEYHHASSMRAHDNGILRMHFFQVLNPAHWREAQRVSLRDSHSK